MKSTPHQLKLFFDDVKTRLRVNGLCQFRKGDKFYDYLNLDDRAQPTMLEVVVDKKYRGPLSQVVYVRWGESEQQTVEAIAATAYIDTGKWVQIGF
ncbi:MAG: hypothetical protein V4714_17365 [Bacteroidota bacterium]